VSAELNKNTAMHCHLLALCNTVYLNTSWLNKNNLIREQSPITHNARHYQPSVYIIQPPLANTCNII